MCKPCLKVLKYLTQKSQNGYNKTNRRKSLKGKAMGIDYGSVRIGIAMSDPLRIISSPFETYVRKNIDADVDYILGLVKTNNVTTIVFGMPLNMDGTQSDTGIAVKEFAQKIAEGCDCEIIFQDERLSSVEAEEFLIQANIKREQRKAMIDKIAAQIILQSFLERS